MSTNFFFIESYGKVVEACVSYTAAAGMWCRTGALNVLLFWKKTYITYNFMVNGNKLSSLVRHHIREFTLRFPGVLIVFFLSLTYLVNGNKVSG